RTADGRPYRRSAHNVHTIADWACPLSPDRWALSPSCREHRCSLLVGEGLYGLADRHRGHPCRSRYKPVGYQAGTLLGRLAQYPADGLLDEELLVVEHCVCVPGE